MNNTQIVNQGTREDGLMIYTLGTPDYTGLTKAEKRILLLPLVEQIRTFYNSEENVIAFEQWKSEYLQGLGGSHNFNQMGKA